MKKIEGSPKNLRELLQNTKYTIHYYQREYMWQRKHIEELIDDLTSEFLDYYHKGDTRQMVRDYGAYFMGSIVLAGDEKSIIDGQQRFSSLTLLLMYLNNRIKANGQTHSSIEPMIFSDQFGEKSFNIDVEERAECMNAIFNSQPFDTTNAGESVKNLYGRYNDIMYIFPHDKIPDEILLHFCDWLTEKVYFIEIVATTEQDAHKIFVTMNDRGLSLTSTEMLKGYLLSEIKDDGKREKLNAIWKDKVLHLKKDDDNGDETFIKSWLRSQYAETIREGKAGATNKDFDLIGGSFHKWVRDEKYKIGLNNTDDYEAFIKKFEKYADVYMRIKDAENNFAEETKYIYYNARVNFTLQPQLLLAPICYEDDWDTVIEKINLTARFIDLYIISRFTNYKTLNYSTIKNFVFNITKDIRGCTIPELKEKLNAHYITFESKPKDVLPDLKLNSFTKKYIKNMLARITGFIEEQTGVDSNYCNYMAQNKNPFEIEHIISDHFERYTKEFTDQNDFNQWRNSVGALLLLHKSINASINDAEFRDKLEAYETKGNIYSASLGESAYNNHPRFKRFIEDNNLPFRSYVAFGKIEIKERNELLVQLVQLVWNNDLFVD